MEFVLFLMINIFLVFDKDFFVVKVGFWVGGLFELFELLNNGNCVDIGGLFWVFGFGSVMFFLNGCLIKGLGFCCVCWVGFCWLFVWFNFNYEVGRILWIFLLVLWIILELLLELCWEWIDLVLLFLFLLFLLIMIGELGVWVWVLDLLLMFGGDDDIL